MIWVKMEALNNLIVECDGITTIHHYDTFEEFINIFKDKYYNNIMDAKYKKLV